MKNEKFAWQDGSRQIRMPLLVLASLSLLVQGVPAQTIRVDTTAARAIKFDPDQALGSSMDILQTNLVDRIYSEAILKESLSAGWGPITYRQEYGIDDREIERFLLL
jgi:hypothetical protein